MSSSDSRRIRPAQPSDHAAYARLFPELAVPDSILSPEDFARAMAPTTLVIEAGSGPEPERVVGYVYFQIMKSTAYVRHIITGPEARRAGVGRALMRAVAERARQAGCTEWCLNVKPENVAAIALYEQMGMEFAHTSQALEIAWSIVEAGDRVYDTSVTARAIDPSEDVRVEPAMKLVDGQLASARAHGHVVHGLFEPTGAATGATIFNPKFPGAYPFRVARPELAMVLLRAIHPYALPEHAAVRVVVEGQPEIGAALLGAGATLIMNSQHMKAALPAA